MDDVHDLLKRALAVVQTEPATAARILAAGAEKARAVGDQRGASILARHAGVVLTELGDVSGALRCYDEALSASPDDAYLYLIKADVHARLGQEDEAVSALARSLQLAVEHADIDLIEMAAEARARYA